MTDKPNKDDSKTLDVQRKTRFTDRMTVKMEPEVKRLLKEFSRRTGIISCQIIHALLTGYLTAMSDKIKLDVQSPTINLTIERQVQRVRRYEKGYVAEPVMGSGPEWEGVTSVMQDVVTKATVKVYGSRLKCSITSCPRRAEYRVNYMERHGGPITQFFCGEHFKNRRKELMRRRVIWGYGKL